MHFGINPVGLPNPANSEEVMLRVEENVVDCDGAECNRYWDGEFLPAHDHLVVTGNHPDAGPRKYALRRDLPESVFESSHE